MIGRPDFSRAVAARLLDTTPAALTRQVSRGARGRTGGPLTLDGVTIRKRGRGVRVDIDRRWTDNGVPLAWLSVQHTADELGVPRNVVAKRLEPARRGSTKKAVEFELLGRRFVARKLGRLWRLRVLASRCDSNGEAA